MICPAGRVMANCCGLNDLPINAVDYHLFPVYLREHSRGKRNGLSLSDQTEAARLRRDVGGFSTRQDKPSGLEPFLRGRR
jgi:hypothetical protein